eukprot:224285_1
MDVALGDLDGTRDGTVGTVSFSFLACRMMLYAINNAQNPIIVLDRMQNPTLISYENEGNNEDNAETDTITVNDVTICTIHSLVIPMESLTFARIMLIRQMIPNNNVATNTKYTGGVKSEYTQMVMNMEVMMIVYKMNRGAFLQRRRLPVIWLVEMTGVITLRYSRVFIVCLYNKYAR